MRKLEEVIDQMLAVIPADEDHLRATLESHRRSAEFSSRNFSNFVGEKPPWNWKILFVKK